MHMYQKHILDLLRTNQQLHYGELRPSGVESSHFKYHLDQLRQDGLVERVDRGVYTLTLKGKMAVDRLSAGRINPMQTPKVITYTLLRDDDAYYLQRKLKEPFLGKLNMVSGKVHLGERTIEAAKREVGEKTGLTVTSIQQNLVAEVRIHESGELISHFVAYVFTASFEGDAERLVKVMPGSVSALVDSSPDLFALVKAIETSETFVDLNLTV